MTGLPVEAADALIVDTVFLVVFCMVTGEAEWFFRCGVVKGEMIEFLEEGESIEVMEGIYKVSLLFVYDRVSGSDVFETVVCLVSTVQGEEGAARLAVSEDRDIQLFVIQQLMKEEGVFQGWISAFGKGSFGLGNCWC